MLVGVAVSGASGTVGRHIVDELSAAGVPVRALSRHVGAGDPGPPGLVERVRFSFVAAVAARCLLETAPTRGAFDVTGPVAISHAQVADALSSALGRRIRYTRPSLPRYWAHAHRTGMPAALAAATSVLYTVARAGVGARVTDDVEKVLDRPPGDIHRFVTDYRHTWTG